MNFVTVFLVSFLISFVCFFAIRFISSNRRIRKYKSVCSLILDAKNNLMLARRSYYFARFAENESETETIQKAAEKLYKDSLSILDSEEIRNEISEFPEELKDSLTRIMDEPRYPLF